MKVKVEFTVDVDKAVVERYLSDLGSDEGVREFVSSYLAAGTMMLDETILNAIGEYHTTNITKIRH